MAIKEARKEQLGGVGKISLFGEKREDAFIKLITVNQCVETETIIANNCCDKRRIGEAE